MQRAGVVILTAGFISAVWWIYYFYSQAVWTWTPPELHRAWFTRSALQYRGVLGSFRALQSGDSGMILMKSAAVGRGALLDPLMTAASSASVFCYLLYAPLFSKEEIQRRRLSRGMCPVCLYSMKGIREVKCPECGWSQNRIA